MCLEPLRYKRRMTVSSKGLNWVFDKFASKICKIGYLFESTRFVRKLYVRTRDSIFYVPFETRAVGFQALLSHSASCSQLQAIRPFRLTLSQFRSLLTKTPYHIAGTHLRKSNHKPFHLSSTKFNERNTTRYGISHFKTLYFVRDGETRKLFGHFFFISFLDITCNHER